MWVLKYGSMCLWMYVRKNVWTYWEVDDYLSESATSSSTSTTTRLNDTHLTITWRQCVRVCVCVCVCEGGGMKVVSKEWQCWSITQATTIRIISTEHMCWLQLTSEQMVNLHGSTFGIALSITLLVEERERERAGEGEKQSVMHHFSNSSNR